MDEDDEIKDCVAEGRPYFLFLRSPGYWLSTESGRLCLLREIWKREPRPEVLALGFRTNLDELVEGLRSKGNLGVLGVLVLVVGMRWPCQCRRPRSI